MGKWPFQRLLVTSKYGIVTAAESPGRSIHLEASDPNDPYFWLELGPNSEGLKLQQ